MLSSIAQSAQNSIVRTPVLAMLALVLVFVAIQARADECDLCFIDYGIATGNCTDDYYDGLSAAIGADGDCAYYIVNHSASCFFDLCDNGQRSQSEINSCVALMTVFCNLEISSTCHARADLQGERQSCEDYATFEWDFCYEDYCE